MSTHSTARDPAPLPPYLRATDSLCDTSGGRRLCYMLLPAMLLMMAIPLQMVTWRSGPDLHTLLEIVASVISLMIGVTALVRFYTRRSNLYLLVGAGFLGAALLDGYHAVATSRLVENLTSSFDALVAWSWNSSRTYLALMMAFGWWAARREERDEESARLGVPGVSIMVITLLSFSLTFIRLVPLPRAYYPELLLGRPQDLIPGVFFAIALAGFLRKGTWRRDIFEHWLVLSLLIGVACQTIVMPRSFHLYDAMFDLAHILKLGAYLCVAVGLLSDMYRMFSRAEANAVEMSQLNTELAREVEIRRVAEKDLTILASTLAKPPPASPLKDKTFTIPGFSLTDMMACGAAIRGLADEVEPGIASGEGLTEEASDHIAFGSLLVNYLRSSLVGEDGSPAFALVRLFETRRLDQLPPELQEALRRRSPGLTEDTRCLTLLASAGAQEPWNHVSRSADHQVIPLPSSEAIAKLPMISQLIRQLGFEVGGILRPESDVLLRTTLGVFHVPEAKGSPFIPAQEDFVEPNGIRSAVGFGDALADGRLFAVIMFSTVPISPDTAALLSHLAHSTRMALLNFADVPDRVEAIILSLNRLLANHEAIVSGQEKHLIKTLAELTETNKELKRSNTELDQFANIASHDLRSPLRNIDDLAQWIAEDAGAALPEGSRRHLETLRRRVNRMDRLLNDLLQYSRVGRSESAPTLVEVSELVREVVELISPPPGFEIRVTDTLPRLHTPATALRRVFQNLLENAIKHHDRVHGTVLISCRELGDRVEFTIQDDGPGIEPRFHGKIFEVFQTLSRRDEVEASGIGLAMVKKTVQSYGGKITVNSDGSRGTSFRFTWKKTS